MTSTKLDAVTSHIDDNFNNSVDRLIEWLKIPSVSTDSQFDEEVLRAANWMGDQLAALGFEIKLIKTPGHPVLYAERKSANQDAPTALYYGHYDVQPGDPFELWDTAPFEPVIKDSKYGKKLVARGAQDDKGQVMTFIEAFRAWIEVAGDLPCNIKIMLEGEEESGSANLAGFLKANNELLKADVCVVCDTGMWDIDTPAITYALRGIVDAEITIKGPNRDLHSGMYGGAVINPLHALASIVAQLHDENGTIQIDNFYNGVPELGPEERKQFADLNHDDEGFFGEIGLSGAAGEKEYTTPEKLWVRPTCDVNGMWGGYTGKGHKTVIAAQASLKLSCRLVGEQDPQSILDNIEKFFTERLPKDFTMSISNSGRGLPIKLSVDSPYLQAAIAGLDHEFDNPTKLIGMGGSIPAVGQIKETLGLDSVMVGFGLSDDNIHSPNEKYELTCLQRGIRSHAAILAKLADVK
ncbi:dipeptidase [Maritalea sp.]|uniref:dipeptidase n=1 Tax=Maritalea sp. TaxID=2003361 RepID=UPI003EF8A4D0